MASQEMPQMTQVHISVQLLRTIKIESNNKPRHDLENDNPPNFQTQVAKQVPNPRAVRTDITLTVPPKTATINTTFKITHHSGTPHFPFTEI